MRFVALVILLLSLALAGLGPATALSHGEATQPAAQLMVSVEPEVVEFRGPGVVTLAIHLAGTIRCTPGLPGPEPVQGRIVPQEASVLERLDARVEPSEFTEEWEAVGTDQYVMNATVIAHVHVEATPVVREQTNFSVIIEETQAQSTRTRCSLEGYRVEETQENVPLIVSPAEADDDDGAGLPVSGINWAPLALAIALLAVVSIFAMKRDRERSSE